MIKMPGLWERKARARDVESSTVVVIVGMGWEWAGCGHLGTNPREHVTEYPIEPSPIPHHLNMCTHI